MMARKRYFMVFLIFIFFSASAYLIAEYLSCADPFPGNCTIGGCDNPLSASGCGLFWCAGKGQVIVLCARPPWPI